jgi:hypothetical protein
MVASQNGGRPAGAGSGSKPNVAGLAGDEKVPGDPVGTEPDLAVALPILQRSGSVDRRRYHSMTGASYLSQSRRSSDPEELTAIRPRPEIAVLLPCRNEEATIGEVIADFHHALPHACIYVYDNGSTDQTASIAKRTGAIVAHVPRRGKGYVLRRMFADISADVYVLADGDGTYDASAAPVLVAALLERHLDMVVGRRVDEGSGKIYRHGHRLGNQLFTRVVECIFGRGLQDMLSGYRVFSRRYVRSFPASSRGFEIETEMTVHALDLCVPFAELPTSYRARPPSSASKLRTIPDGLRILSCILLLCKEFRPARFFGSIVGLLCLIVGVTNLIFPGTAGGPTTRRNVDMIGGLLIVVCIIVGLILDSVSRGRREMKRVLYLAACDRDLGIRSEGDLA